MPGANRRPRRLKQSTTLGSIGEFSSVNPQDGDILIFDFAAGVYENGRALLGDYSLSGRLTATDLTVTNDVTIQDALNVTGNTGLGGDLAVIGTTTLNGNATAAGTFGVTGVVTLSDALSVAGALTGSGFSFTGDGTITGTLDVTGVTTLGNAAITTLDVGGDSTLTGFLAVTGVAQFNDTVTVNAALSATSLAGDSVSSAGTLTAGGTFFWPSGNISDDLSDMTLASTFRAGHLIITGKQTDGTVVSMLDLDPDAHHIIGGIDGVIVPVGTTAQEPSGVDGMIRYDSTTTKFRVFENSAWVDMIHAPSTDVTLAGTPDYLTISGQVITQTELVATTDLTATGTKDSTTFLRGDDTWAVPGGGSVALNDLTDVTLTSPTTGGVLYKSAGDWLDTSAIFIDPTGKVGLKFNGTETIISTTFGAAILSGGGSTTALLEMTSVSGANSSINFLEAGTAKGQLQYNATNNEFYMRATVSGEKLRFFGVAGTMVQMVDAGAVTLNYNAILEAATKSGGFKISNELEVDGALNHDGSTVGFYGTTPTTLQTGVAVTAAGIHAALVTLGLITA